MSIQILLRAGLQTVSLLLGGSGIFFLWESFYAPAVASYTLIFLTAATCITLAMPKTAH